MVREPDPLKTITTLLTPLGGPASETESQAPKPQRHVARFTFDTMDAAVRLRLLALPQPELSDLTLRALDALADPRLLPLLELRHPVQHLIDRIDLGYGGRYPDLLRASLTTIEDAADSIDPTALQHVSGFEHVSQEGLSRVVAESREVYLRAQLKELPRDNVNRRIALRYLSDFLVAEVARGSSTVKQHKLVFTIVDRINNELSFDRRHELLLALAKILRDHPTSPSGAAAAQILAGARLKKGSELDLQTLDLPLPLQNVVEQESALMQVIQQLGGHSRFERVPDAVQALLRQPRPDVAEECTLRLGIGQTPLPGGIAPLARVLLQQLPEQAAEELPFQKGVERLRACVEGR